MAGLDQRALGPPRERQRLRGFTLVEVLVAVVVLSIGLLGVFSLQANTLASSYSAYLTSVASVQAMDLEERIRVNHEAIDRYLAVNDGDQPIDIAQIAPDSPPASCQSAASACTDQNLAAHDIGRWAYRTSQLFPASLEVGLQELSAGTFQLKLRWTEPNRGDDDDNSREFAYIFRLESV